MDSRAPSVSRSLIRPRLKAVQGHATRSRLSCKLGAMTRQSPKSYRGLAITTYNYRLLYDSSNLVADYLSVLLAIQYSKELDFLYLFTLDPDILYQTTTLTYPSASEIMSLRSADPKDKRSSFKELQTSLHGVRFPRCSLNIPPSLSLLSIRNQDDN